MLRLPGTLSNQEFAPRFFAQVRNPARCFWRWCAVLALGVIFSGTARAGAVTNWTGNFDADWSNVSNWLSNVPTSGYNVVIDTTGANQPELTADSFTDDITIAVDSDVASLLISNGFSLTSSGSGVIGENSDANGTVLVTGLNSAWVESSTLTVGASGNGTLTVADGGYVTVSGEDGNGIGAYIGENAGSNGTVLVTDVQSGIASLLNVTTGALAVGYSGTGNLTVANGGRLYASGEDANDIGLYVGENAGSSGNLLITDVEPNSGAQSYLQAYSMVVGGNGTGNFTVANGGYAYVYAHDANFIALSLGSEAGGNGTALVTGVTGAGIQSELELGSGTLVVGYNGTGCLTVANGGYVDVEGFDANGVGAYVGENAGSSGNVLVTDVQSGDASELYLTGGALVVGGNGTGTLTVANGGYVNPDGLDSDGMAMYLGQDAGGNGTVTVTDPGSNLTVGDNVSGNGALVVGNLGIGSLTVSNGAVVNAYGSSGYNLGVDLGNQTG